MAAVRDHIHTETVTEWERHLEMLTSFYGLIIKIYSLFVSSAALAWVSEHCNRLSYLCFGY